MDEGTPLGIALSTAGLSKSTWFYRSHTRKPKPLDPELEGFLNGIDGYELCYGYRKLTELAERQGLHFNEKRVLRHTRALGMLQPKKRKGMQATFLERVVPTVPNTYWESDFTTVDSGEGREWVCAIVDPALGSDQVAGRMTERCRAKEAIEVLEAAVLREFPAEGRVPEGHLLVLRVDRGGQFIAGKYRETAKRLGVVLEFCGVKCPNDKPNIECLFGLFKKEEVYRSDYRTRQQARLGYAMWSMWYSTKRLHSTLGYRTPDEVRSQPALVTA